MTIEMVKTSNMLKLYLEENNFTINDLLKVTDVSSATLYNFFAGRGKFTYKIALGINKLMPELSIPFLMKYDAEYNAYVSEFTTQNNIKNPKELISYFSLDKFYPEFKGSDIDLCKIGMNVFGKENFINKRIDFSEVSGYAFAKASKPNEVIACTRVKNTLVNAKKVNTNWERKKLDYEALNYVLNNIYMYSATTTIEETKDTFELIANEIGINYYFANSVPNSRVKGVSVLTNEGSVFVLVSDLFHCIENLWLTFIHELIHIKTNDFYNSLSIGDGKAESIERKVEEDVAELLIGNFQFNKNISLIENAYEMSNVRKIPVGLAAELIRSKTNTYSNRDLNGLVHIYKIY